MRTGNTRDTEDSADEDALAQVREGEPASFGSWNFERSEFRDQTYTTIYNFYEKYNKR